MISHLSSTSQSLVARQNSQDPDLDHLFHGPIDLAATLFAQNPRIAPNLENYICFQRTCAKARFTFKNFKRTTWREYTSSLTPRTTISKIWNKIRAIKGSRSYSTPLIHSLKSPTLPKLLAHTLLKSVPSANPSTTRKASNSHSQANYNSDITIDELCKSIKLTRASAPGADDFHIYMLKNACSFLSLNYLSP